MSKTYSQCIREKYLSADPLERKKELMLWDILDHLEKAIQAHPYVAHVLILTKDDLEEMKKDSELNVESKDWEHA